jgi:hypothetical protein
MSPVSDSGDRAKDPQPADRSRRRILAAAALAVGFIGAGCGQRDPRVTIQGTVAFDGKPLTQGQVVFVPDNTALRAEGATVKDGGFTIRVHKGPHRVEINAEVKERRDTGPDAAPEAGITTRSIIPPRYNEKSTLMFDVQSAQDKPAFDLTSDK